VAIVVLELPGLIFTPVIGCCNPLPSVASRWAALGICCHCIKLRLDWVSCKQPKLPVHRRMSWWSGNLHLGRFKSNKKLMHTPRHAELSELNVRATCRCSAPASAWGPRSLVEFAPIGLRPWYDIPVPNTWAVFKTWWLRGIILNYTSQYIGDYNILQ